MPDYEIKIIDAELKADNEIALSVEIKLTDDSEIELYISGQFSCRTTAEKGGGDGWNEPVYPDSIELWELKIPLLMSDLEEEIREKIQTEFQTKLLEYFNEQAD